ncbi:tail fiber domain-containing protein [Citrobacter portucalensis]|uniref:tail fiber domain-containing protein n=1 Tax=Citrobacter portucalensis TaxID=1639133 RepID=UPI001EDC4FCC|nr:tail fiber domain-containing protein [Citrobacter portucalensis]UKK90554.1 tail fiber domain-containing protein [Citrobacter portucalensis]
MSAGTLTLTNNSAAVAGNGTAFTTEVAAGDFIVVTVGGVPYTLPIKSVESGTALTLVSNFTGPTQSGAAWSAVPRVALNMVTAALVAQSAEALRGLNYDKQNWQSIFSGTGDVTVRLPDGSSFTGPAWNDITSALSGKADKVNGVVPIEQGGTGLPSPFGNSKNTFCQGNDSRLDTVDGKSSGKITGPLSVVGNSIRLIAPVEGSDGWASSLAFAANDTSGTELANIYTSDIGAISIVTSAMTGPQEFRFGKTGSATAPGSWVPNSDERLKDGIVRIEDPLSKMRSIKGCTWTRKDTGLWGIGFIAQDVMLVFPEAVTEAGDRKLMDGTTVEGILSPDTYGVSAALHHESILALMDIVEELKLKIDDMTIQTS